MKRTISLQQINFALLPQRVPVRKVRRALQEFIRGREAESAARYQDAVVVGGRLISDVVKRARKMSQKTSTPVSPGRLPKEALRSYVRRVITIYHDATGEWPSLKHRTAGDHTRQKRPHPFIIACLRAADVCRWSGDRGYPYGLVDQVLRELNPHKASGRPAKHI